MPENLVSQSRSFLARTLLSSLYYSTLLLVFITSIHAQTRVAIIDFVGDDTGELTNQFRSSLQQSKSSELTIIDERAVRLALKGSGYQGVLNLSREEARALGLSLGSDFYVLGLMRVIRRIISADNYYFDVISGLFLVESRSGKLLQFRFAHERANDEPTARRILMQRMSQEGRLAPPVFSEAAHIIENRISDDMIDLSNDETTKLKLVQPLFYQHLKPAYPFQAELLGLTATIELDVVFRADGRVGEIEVIRWGGFGLDESAIATAQQLRFKPAELNGRTITVRGRVRYNFRK